MLKKEVVLTGMGVLSPIGNDPVSYWTALCQGISGISRIWADENTEGGTPLLSSLVSDFNVKEILKLRKYQKNLKVMSRDVQLGFVSAMNAVTDSGLVLDGDQKSVDPERFGVVFGSDLIGLEIEELLEAFKLGMKDGKHDFSTWGRAAMDKIFPLWMLKYLPNMIGGHLAIALDARGPNNTLTLRRCSSFAAMIEGIRVIERGDADVMLCGGAGNRANPSFLARGKTYELVPRTSDPDAHPRPYDADRCGGILGEGAAAFTLERKEFALARGAKILAEIKGFASVVEPALYYDENLKRTGEGVRRVIRLAMSDADRKADDLSHINADGQGTVFEDRLEAQAIHEELGNVPVTAPKGAFGDLGSGSGAVELAASVLGLQQNLIPPTRNHVKTASDCPIDVVHGVPRESQKSTVLAMNHSRTGRSVALVIEKV
ncbi:MAG: beta-ketoacyl-[acyl-carrier-protein] synthase family protein [Planctomycetaceae bacterium]|jgi:3-oxoacyl-[acyl-carrier-protein] synthase II|nr:beta-ketoacyl-[acyl-carrier-protein] synthase family protein [Planctomycetaceae bacterium]